MGESRGCMERGHWEKVLGRNGRNVQTVQETGSLGRNLGIRLHGLKAFCSWLPSCRSVKIPLDPPGQGWVGAWSSATLAFIPCFGLWFPILVATSSFSDT